MQTPLPSSTWRLEALAVALATAVGMVLRAWPPGRLGLTHFDEGIYAIAGTWIYPPHRIDPMLIPYAPPGFPILVGLMYAILGPSDVAAIAVSQVAGTATIPVVAWLARRTFGAGSGFAAATLVALSGPHIAFSRMALTDASFLLAWLMALGAGMRFLERPGLARALAMGLAVGMAQDFKYNGWLAGGIVLATALFGMTTHRESRLASRWKRTFGWGGLAVIVAALVVLPWFLFVEGHGGYSGLLRHQRSYLGGWARWPSAFRAQAAQAVGLSGARWLVIFAWLAAGIGAWLVRSISISGGRPTTGDRSLIVGALAAGALILDIVPDGAWWLGLLLLPGLLLGSEVSTRLMGVGWLILSVLTPLYHPYARLWLPVQAAGWIILGGMLGAGFAGSRAYLRRLRGRAMSSDPSFLRFGLAWGWLLAVGTGCSIFLEKTRDFPRVLPGLLAPSDSLRHAASRIVAKMPADVRAVRFFGRPSLAFYLGGRIPLATQGESKTLFRPGDARTWILTDEAVLPPSTFFGPGRWSYSETIDSRLALPTLLDIHPGAASHRDARIISRWGDAELRLFRSRPPEEAP